MYLVDMKSNVINLFINFLLFFQHNSRYTSVPKCHFIEKVAYQNILALLLSVSIILFSRRNE